MGITTLEEFGKLNPYKLKIISLGFREKQKQKLQEENVYAYLHGRYMVEALASTVGNMFKKKGSRPYEYPKEPIELDTRDKPKNEMDAVNRFFENNARLREKWRKNHKKHEGDAS